MSRSDDPDHYFQTSASIATSARRKEKSKNKYGNPIDTKAKILSVIPGPEDPVYIACADGLARRIDYHDAKVIATYTGANAPLTSLALSPDTSLLFAGCWNKSIHSWTTSSSRPYKRFSGGHTDFVKCVTTAKLKGQDVLISGGADASIIIWAIDSGAKLHVLKGHARGVLDVAVDPTSPLAQPESGFSILELFSADSVREIRRWRVTPTSAEASDAGEALVVHETSVSKLFFDAGAEVEDVDLWTASSDRTTKRLVRGRRFEEDTRLDHPDYVRDVVGNGRVVVTACRDEEVRVWDASSGKLLCVYSGHFDEVTGLALVQGGKQVVSVSLDGTVRLWSLEVGEMEKAMAAREQVEDVPAEEESKAGNVMTAEEEAELAELMDSD